MNTTVDEILAAMQTLKHGTSEILIEEELMAKLKKKKPLKVKAGFDPTAPDLHLGHTVLLNKMKQFQDLGHEVVFLIGDFTAMIGDPSGKSKERPLLDDAAIAHNLSCIRKNFEKVLDFSGKLPMPELLNNADWFSNYLFIDFLRDIGKHFRIGSMLAKDSVKSRIESEEGMSFTEFSYQLVQSYDFYHLFQQGVTLQMGGSDQWGNITAGTDLIRKLLGKPGYGLTFPLLVRSDGKKFGKSEEGAVWLSEDKFSAYEFYQYVIRIPDEDVIRMMKMLTFIEMQEIRDLEASMKTSEYIPNTAQKRLAEELTRRLHGSEGLEKAIRATEGAGPGSLEPLNADIIEKIALDMPNVELLSSEVLHCKFTEVAVLSKLLSSKGEATRLIQNQGAYLNNVRVDDLGRVILKEDLIGGRFLLLGSGKKKKVLVRVKN